MSKRWTLAKTEDSLCSLPFRISLHRSRVKSWLRGNILSADQNARRNFRYVLVNRLPKALPENDNRLNNFIGSSPRAIQNWYASDISPFPKSSVPIPVLWLTNTIRNFFFLKQYKMHFSINTFLISLDPLICTNSPSLTSNRKTMQKIPVFLCQTTNWKTWLDWCHVWVLVGS